MRDMLQCNNISHWLGTYLDWSLVDTNKACHAGSHYWDYYLHILNTLRPRQNGRHFADNTFKYIFLNENVIISAKISLTFGPKGPINDSPALVQIMGWRRPGDKPLSESMMVRLPTHICVSRPQWVNMFKSGPCNSFEDWAPVDLVL